MTQPRIFNFDPLPDSQGTVKNRRHPIEHYLPLLHQKYHDADPDRLAGMLGLLRDASEASAHYYTQIGPIDRYQPKTHGYDLCAHRLRQIEDAKHLLAEGVTL
jgi:hypothetical protein